MVSLSLLLYPNLSDPWELYHSLIEPDGPGQSEAVPHSFSLEPRETNPLPLLSITMEVLKRYVEVSESLLRSTL